jgi:hypothetical protein
MASDVRVAKSRDFWPRDAQSKQAVARADAHSIAGLLGAALAVLRNGRRGADAFRDARSSGGLYVAPAALRPEIVDDRVEHVAQELAARIWNFRRE